MRMYGQSGAIFAHYVEIHRNFLSDCHSPRTLMTILSQATTPLNFGSVNRSVFVPLPYFLHFLPHTVSLARFVAFGLFNVFVGHLPVNTYDPGVSSRDKWICTFTSSNLRAHSRLLNYLIGNCKQHIVFSSKDAEVEDSQIQRMIGAVRRVLLANANLNSHEHSLSGYFDLLQVLL